MSKTLGALVTLAGAVVANVATGGLASVAIAVGSAIAGYAISALDKGRIQKPETTESSIKTERPVRIRAYGITRQSGQAIHYP